MKLNYKIIFLILAAVLMFGCAKTSKQFVEKPDINSPLNEEESIIKLKRVKYFNESGNSPDVIANGTIIGELANNDEIIWKTKSNSFECISINYDRSLLDNVLFIKLDSTPLPYKCFSAKPKEVLSLKYDFKYPEMNAIYGAKGLAAVPIFKDKDKNENLTSISIGIITSEAMENTEIDVKGLLLASMKERFKEKLADASIDTIDLEILDYKTGNAALRFLGSSYKGSTLAKVKVVIRHNNIVTDTFITRPVISGGASSILGALATAGADTYIFDKLAEDIYLYFYEP